MADTGILYGSIAAKAFNKEIDLDSDTIKVSLHTSTYTPDQDVHDYYNDVTNEVTGTGYTAGGITLANKTVGYTAGTNVFKFDADDVQWTGSTITARYAVIYDATPGTAATNPLLAYIDFGADKSSAAGTFTIQFNAAGIFTATIT